MRPGHQVHQVLALVAVPPGPALVERPVGVGVDAEVGQGGQVVDVEAGRLGQRPVGRVAEDLVGLEWRRVGQRRRGRRGRRGGGGEVRPTGGRPPGTRLPDVAEAVVAAAAAVGATLADVVTKEVDQADDQNDRARRGGGADPPAPMRRRVRAPGTSARSPARPRRPRVQAARAAGPVAGSRRGRPAGRVPVGPASGTVRPWARVRTRGVVGSGKAVMGVGRSGTGRRPGRP